jgi:hypothetical protein
VKEVHRGCKSTIYVNTGLWWVKMFTFAEFKASIIQLADALLNHRCANRIVWRSSVAVQDSAFTAFLPQLRFLTGHRMQLFDTYAAHVMEAKGIPVFRSTAPTIRPKGLRGLDFDLRAADRVCFCRDDKRHVTGEVLRAWTWEFLQAQCRVTSVDAHPPVSLPPWHGTSNSWTPTGEASNGYCRSIDCCKTPVSYGALDENDWGEKLGNCQLESAADQHLMALHRMEK